MINWQICSIGLQTRAGRYGAPHGTCRVAYPRYPPKYIIPPSLDDKSDGPWSGVVNPGSQSTRCIRFFGMAGGHVPRTTPVLVSHQGIAGRTSLTFSRRLGRGELDGSSACRNAPQRDGHCSTSEQVEAYGYGRCLVVDGATGATLQPCNSGWGQVDGACSEMSVGGIVENAKGCDWPGVPCRTRRLRRR